MNKRLVGGDYLLDLTPIAIEESEDGETYTNITNAEVLEQLTNLKKYVNNPNMIKPVWVKFNNGETNEKIVARGTFAVVDANEFEICVQIDGYKLKIHIEFTQATLSDDTPIDDWYIDTNDAKYLFTSDAQNVKATIEDADFGDVALAGDLSVGGDLSVTGNITGDSIIENMTGYSFVPVENSYDDLNVIYAGACKNGNKLTLVMFMTFTYKLPAFKDVGIFVIPSDIYAKLYPYTLDNVATLDCRTLDLVKERQSIPSNAYGEIFKSSNNAITFSFAVPAGLTADATYAVRYEATFLLSENLVPESQGE